MNIDLIDVSTLHPQEGDTIIIRVRDRLTDEQRVNVIRKFSQDFFPGHQVLIFDNEASLEIIHKVEG